MRVLSRSLLKPSFCEVLLVCGKDVSVRLTGTTKEQTLHMVNECFGVGVVSEPRMASAGVEPGTGSSTD